MIGLGSILYGVQPAWSRQMPYIPPQWQELVFGETVIDSREVEPGTLFVALAGERTDGHIFLPDVIARGALGALVSRTEIEARATILARTARRWALVDPVTGAGLDAATPGACLLIAVDDPLMALQRLSAYHRRQFTPTVVGITGSVGKTSTKEAVAALLRQRFSTLKSKRSFNSEATVPTTLLQLAPTHEVAVLEMGMWAPGEIRFLADLARPQIGLVTNVGPTHLERLKSQEAIWYAKAELVEWLPRDGWAVLNADDPLVLAMRDMTNARVFTYGLSPQATLWADQIESYGLNGIAMRVHYQDQQIALRLPLIGRHSVYLALAALSVGLIMEMEWPAMLAGLSDPAAQMRLRVVAGQSGTHLIDDTYNAAPISTLAALDLLADTQGRRVAILGDMLELGSAEEEGHRQVGLRVAEVADLLVTVGQRAGWIAEAARQAGMAAEQIVVCMTNAEAIASVRPRLMPGDYILLKASRGMALEEIVVALQPQQEA
ncbi:UDP-N-acetylmuramoyl-tripeptide--D-alanyl-D-alanine ligase [Candidatus Oscillochloris fontis]|uniref:UDP-N-acetylmuramoyl-tripeptide--D-alanyl-D- alanine ligase n=1 Tax=Candidatus Oscillochloris fontis TaxID=2496868 RepID=UPI00101B86A3|nr:UDP-N-acetylmuramoyl-tripeptide--D-alanyl-D-alanine ligase [Candidatus Oscillochloris fontis]